MMRRLFRKKIIRQLFFYLALLFIWQSVCYFKFWPEYIFPSPLKVIDALISGFADLTFIYAIAVSLKRIVIGYGISIITGTVLGILMYRFSWVEETVGGLVLAVQTLPSICWLPLSIIWFGLNERAVIFVVIMGAVFSVTMAVDTGFKNIPLIYLQAGKNMGARGFKFLREVMLPASCPVLVVGLKQGWSFAWRSLMAGELLFVSMGLGYLLMAGRELNDMAQVIAVMIVICSVSIIVDRVIFGRLEAEVKKRWGFRRKI
jgi:NitT/TauT family transport system permease protein